MSIDDDGYKLIVENAPNMIWVSGTDAKCYYFNQTWLAFTGRTLEQERGEGWTQGVHPDDMDRCISIYLKAFEERRAFEMEYRLKRHDGQYRWINDCGTPRFREHEFIGFIGSCIDVHEIVEGRVLKEMAERDGLTGLYNRAYTEQLLEKIFAEARREARALSVIMIDVDRFKSVNDRLGHKGGDEVLRKVACAITSQTRKSDIIGRYGGDEFLVVLPRTTQTEAHCLAERVRGTVDETQFHDPDLRITVSLGVCGLESHCSPAAMVEQADKNMYLSKSRGGNLTTSGTCTTSLW